MRLLFLAGNRFSEWKVSRNICDSHIGTFRSKTIVFISRNLYTQPQFIDPYNFIFIAVLFSYSFLIIKLISIVIIYVNDNNILTYYRSHVKKHYFLYY